MGKQSRRKGNKKKNLASPRTAAIAQPTSKSSLVNRIRHGDLRVRHGALTAAAATLFSPESLASRSPINMEVIQAISERVIDEDVPCAMCALGCLGNYVLFQERHTHGNKVETLLTPILLTKMRTVCDSVEGISKQMVQAQNTMASVNTVAGVEGENGRQNDGTLKVLEKLSMSMMEQWSILSLCLHALCGIVEGTATNNESSSILFHQREEFIATVMRSLVLANEMITSLNASDSDVKVEIFKKEQQYDIISDVAIYATRTIHSSCDENPTFVSFLMASDGWKVIVSYISNVSLPMLARLHCCGITIISSQVAQRNDVEQIIIEISLPLVSQCITYSNDVASELHRHVSEAHQLLKQEKDDEKIENEIIRKVDKRKESARLIARRQKQMKEQSKANEEMNCEANIHKEKETINSNEDSMLEDSDQAKEENDEKYEKALIAWKNACSPLKLSIEIMTNTFAFLQEDVSDTGADCDDMAWDSDQEEKLLAQAQQAFSIRDVFKGDEIMFKQAVTLGTPDRVLSVFGSIFMTLINTGQNHENIHAEILDDLSDVLAKCSTCLGNMVCSLQSEWKKSQHEIVSVWNDFRQCLEASKDQNSNKNITLPVISSILNVMVALLRFHPILVKSVNEKDLEMILSFVLTEKPEVGKSDDDVTALVSDIQKDAIAMLGILCSEPHPETVNEKICDTFLTLLLRTHSITSSVMSEVLNVLMDMYSADEGDVGNHESVFRRKEVLGAFQKSLPILKRKIREDESRENVSKDDIVMWKEIVLNANRFIKYKKEQ